MSIDQIIRRIAFRHFSILTLNTRRRDRLDFHALSVSQIRAALKEAYHAGAKQEVPLRKTVRRLIKASDALTGAIEGATSEFDAEKRALMDATSAAEKVLKGGGS